MMSEPSASTPVSTPGSSIGRSTSNRGMAWVTTVVLAPETTPSGAIGIEVVGWVVVV